MNYYFLKLGQGNSEVDSLRRRKPTASVYFDAKGEAAYERGAGKSQPRAFWEAGKKENRENTIMVVIHRATVWLLQPGGKVHFGKKIVESGPGWRVNRKEMPVKILARLPSKLVPPVLASMACSQAHGRRTFTGVGHWGDLKAIDSTLQHFGKAKHRRWVPQGNELDSEIAEHWRSFDEKGRINQGAAQLLECLRSTELETLVAKLVEAHGCHVPAHWGGTLGDIDLFAWNDSRDTVNLNGLKIPPHEKISIQVKSWAAGKRCPSAVDYLIGIGVKGKRALDENWVLAEVRKQPNVCRWMIRSLDWLPEWFLELPQFQLAPFLSGPSSDSK
jgi:hypothetical protein